MDKKEIRFKKGKSRTQEKRMRWIEAAGLGALIEIFLGIRLGFALGFIWLPAILMLWCCLSILSAAAVSGIRAAAAECQMVRLAAPGSSEYIQMRHEAVAVNAKTVDIFSYRKGRKRLKKAS